jgi:hypothetical protein
VAFSLLARPWRLRYFLVIDMRKMILALGIAGPLFGAPTAHADGLAPARDAFVKGELARALALARAEIGREPEAAWRLIAACHCFAHDAGAARDAFTHVDARGQELLRFVCARNQIRLP